jgi:hypothetical protein
VHRQLITKAEKITGYMSEPKTPKIDPDPATGGGPSGARAICDE